MLTKCDLLTTTQLAQSMTLVEQDLLDYLSKESANALSYVTTQRRQAEEKKTRTTDNDGDDDDADLYDDDDDRININSMETNTCNQNRVLSQSPEDRLKDWKHLWVPTVPVSASSGAGVHALWTDLKHCAEMACIVPLTDPAKETRQYTTGECEEVVDEGATMVEKNTRGGSIDYDRCDDSDNSSGGRQHSVAVKEHRLAMLMRLKHGQSSFSVGLNNKNKNVSDKNENGNHHRSRRRDGSHGLGKDDGEPLGAKAAANAQRRLANKARKILRKVRG